MQKISKNRQLTPSSEERYFFFPKANPPSTVLAASREEAEAKLADNPQEIV